LVRIVNEHKRGSIGAVLSSAAYRRVFNGVTDMSMYAACFAQATFANDILAPKAGYSGLIDYVFDDGNTYNDHVLEGYFELRRRGVKLGRLNFAQDSLDCAL
jgi:hypothetical protein